MFKIGEFSKITQVSVRMLRYYDEQKLLEPSYVDNYTGYRLYSAEQIEKLNKIIFLRNMGFGVNEMKQILPHWNAESIKKDLFLQLYKIRENIEMEKIRAKQIEGLISDLNNQQNEISIDITLKSLPMVQVISMRKTVADYYCEESMWSEFEPILRKIKNADKLQSFSIYHDLDYRETDVDIEICVVADKPYFFEDNLNIICRQIPEVNVAACFIVHGDYSNISKAYRQFAFWLEQHSEYSMQGENRQICHLSACDTENPQDYITELQIPLTLS